MIAVVRKAGIPSYDHNGNPIPLAERYKVARALANVTTAATALPQQWQDAIEACIALGMKLATARTIATKLFPLHSTASTTHAIRLMLQGK